MAKKIEVITPEEMEKRRKARRSSEGGGGEMFYWATRTNPKTGKKERYKEDKLIWDAMLGDREPPPLPANYKDKPLPDYMID